ncbi:MAG TPA: RodZ domain-containing protein [Novosphingobium sp.]
MAEQDQQQQEQLPLETVGTKLRLAREAAGLSRADISARTKVAERHLAAIEDSDFGRLASATYAIGFSRAYARTVGLDEAEVARAVRAELGAAEDAGDRPEPATFEPGDPARIPGSRLAWVAAFGAIAVIAAVFVFWRNYYSPAVSLPDLAVPETPKPVVSASSSLIAPMQGPVVFTALEQGVWVKFYDASGKQLMQKEMAKGESYTLPADANGPLIRTARPDALTITVGGRPVAPLAERQMTLADVPVSAIALLARGTGTAPSHSADPTAVVQPVAPPAVRSTLTDPAPRHGVVRSSRPTATPDTVRRLTPGPAPTPSQAVTVPSPEPLQPAAAVEGGAASTVSD